MSGSGKSIAFRGRVADGLGIALWQADGSGPEPAASGHRFETPIGTITAHYYIASREYIEPAARGGVAATELVGAWPATRAALAQAERTLGDLVLRLPLTTAGADREGEDWFFKNGVETRHLRPQAALPLVCDGVALVEFAPPRLVLTEDYRGARSFADVRLALVSEPTTMRLAGKSAGDLAGLSGALLADLGGRSVRFVVDAIQLTPHTFDGHGRISARYAELPSARIEVLAS